MNGYSSHTYMWVNAANERFWVKYHFKTNQGVEFLAQDDADRIAGQDADYHQRDLFKALEHGEHPSWTLKMQIMPFEEKTVPFQSVRSHQGLAARRLSTHRRGHDDADSQRHRLPRGDRTGGLPTQQHGAGTGLSPDKMLLARGSRTPMRIAPASA